MYYNGSEMDSTQIMATFEEVGVNGELFVIM